MGRRLGVLVTLAVAAGLGTLAAPGSAAASLVIGQTAPPSGSCFTSSTYRQIGVSSGAGYSSERQNGVITSWSTFGGPAAGQTLQLVTLHPYPAGPAGRYIFDGADVVRDIAPNTLNTFSSGVRVPIVYNGEIGVFVPFNSPASCVFAAPSATDAYAIAPGNPVVGGTANFVGSNPMSRVNASANVEPDFDNDGFGDETQDRCVGTAGTFNGCPNTLASASAAQVGRSPRITVTATAPGAGTLKAGDASDASVASASALKLTSATQNLTSTITQQVPLTLSLTKQAKKKLKKKGKLKVQVKVIYAPPGGSAGAPQVLKDKLKGKKKKRR